MSGRSQEIETMTLKLGRAALVALASLALAGPALAQRRRGQEPRGNPNEATILLHGGRAPLTEVELKPDEIKFEEIRYRRKGSRRSDALEGEDVAEIRWTNPPPAYATGRSQLRANLFERAVQSFTAARNSASGDSWVKAYATFYLAEAQRLLGSHDEAIEEYQRLLQNAGDHYLAPNATYGLGAAQAAAGEYSDASSSFRRLDTGFGDYWRLKGKIGEGEAELAQGNAADARAAFETAEASARSYPDIRRAAQVGIGQAYVADKRFDDAVEFFDRIIRQPGISPEVAGGAWVGKGDCRFQEATERGDADETKLKEALVAYQTCVVRFAGVPEAYPKALYQSARIYRMLGMDELASYQEDELKGRCPNSQWTAKLGE